MTEKQKILQSASDIFFSKGFSKIPVDEIATALRMSKKTIYKYYPSKDHLIKEVVLSFLYEHSINIKSIMGSERNAVEKIYSMTNYIGNQILRVSDKWFLDIFNYSEDLWKAIEDFRFRILNENLRHVIKQGIDEQLFVNKPVVIILDVLIYSIKAIVNPEFINKNKLNPSAALKDTIEILLNGLLTEKGKKVLRKLKPEKV